MKINFNRLFDIRISTESASSPGSGHRSCRRWIFSLSSSLRSLRLDPPSPPIDETLVVLGATSGIARALCRRLAARGCRLVLAARGVAEVEALTRDLEVRYRARVAALRFEALEFDAYDGFVDRCAKAAGGVFDGVVLCYGDLVDQPLAQADAGLARRTIDVNFTSPVLLLDRFAVRLEAQRSGSITVLSSVAGDRGRQSNYTYGAAKAGLTAYLQGLRNRLAHSGVHVLTVKPGFVDTPMTEGRLDPRSALVASPERVARAIDRAMRRRRDVVYTPWFWRGIMAVVRAIPEPIFKRLRL
jgi:short-subunit dehydrogenase